MTSTRIQVKSIVLDRLSVLFDPKHAPVLSDGQPNQRYVAYVETYLEALIPFDAWELEAGTKAALESHKYKYWPLPADMRNYCLRAAKDARPYAKPEKPVYLRGGDEERPPISSEERERNHWRLKVLAEWQDSGKLNAKDEHGNYRHSLADCKAAAARRQMS